MDDFEQLYRSLNGAIPDHEQQEKLDSLRGAAKLYGAEILDRCPPSRERSLALTRLEEAAMWASKAVLFG